MWARTAPLKARLFAPKPPQNIWQPFAVTSNSSWRQCANTRQKQWIRFNNSPLLTALWHYRTESWATMLHNTLFLITYYKLLKVSNNASIAQHSRLPSADCKTPHKPTRNRVKWSCPTTAAHYEQTQSAATPEINIANFFSIMCLKRSKQTLFIFPQTRNRNCTWTELCWLGAVAVLPLLNSIRGAGF